MAWFGSLNLFLPSPLVFSINPTKNNNERGKQKKIGANFLTKYTYLQAKTCGPANIGKWEQQKCVYLFFYLSKAPNGKWKWMGKKLKMLVVVAILYTLSSCVLTPFFHTEQIFGLIWRLYWIQGLWKCFSFWRLLRCNGVFCYSGCVTIVKNNMIISGILKTMACFSGCF